LSSTNAFHCLWDDVNYVDGFKCLDKEDAFRVDIAKGVDSSLATLSQSSYIEISINLVDSIV